MVTIQYKFDKLEHLPSSNGYEEFEKYLRRYMQTNNFRFEEIRYIFSTLDHFYFLKRLTMEDLDGKE